MKSMLHPAVGLMTLLFLCGVAAAGEVVEITAADLDARLGQTPPAVTVLDVRTAEEYAAGHVPGARNIPVGELDTRLGELAPFRGSELVVYCRSGKRARTALETLEAQGFQELRHLAGDMLGWSESGRPVEAAVRLAP